MDTKAAALDHHARHAAADSRDAAADERDTVAVRRALQEKTVDDLEDRDPHGRAAVVRRDALLDRQAAASDRQASAEDRAAESAEAQKRSQLRPLSWGP